MTNVAPLACSKISLFPPCSASSPSPSVDYSHQCANILPGPNVNMETLTLTLLRLLHHFSVKSLKKCVSNHYLPFLSLLNKRCLSSSLFQNCSKNSLQWLPLSNPGVWVLSPHFTRLINSIDPAGKFFHLEIVSFQYPVISRGFCFAGHSSSVPLVGCSASVPPLTLECWAQSFSFLYACSHPRWSHSAPWPYIPSVRWGLSDFHFQSRPLLWTLKSIKEFYFLCPIAYLTYLFRCLTEIPKLACPEFHPRFYLTHTHSHTIYV